MQILRNAFYKERDKRKKYSERLVNTAVELYLEGNGFRRISRLLWKIFRIKVCHHLAVKWIKSTAKKIEFEKTKNTEKETSILGVYVC